MKHKNYQISHLTNHILIIKTTRALRFEANIPKRFWVEYILTVAYIINRLPSKVIKNKTPYELVWNQKPQYDHLKVFRCLAYYQNTNTKGDKFEEKGKPSVFLGYPQGTKGYKVYDIKYNKIIVSRDVLFFESILPSKNTKVDTFGEDDESFKYQNDMCHEGCPIHHSITHNFDNEGMSQEN